MGHNVLWLEDVAIDMWMFFSFDMNLIIALLFFGVFIFPEV